MCHFKSQILGISYFILISRMSDFSYGSTICLRRFTLFSDDLPTSCFEEKSIKTMLPGVAFFNIINGIFRVFYKKFDLIILKIWSLLLFSQSFRELMEDWKERLVNRPRREWIPSDKSLYRSLYINKGMAILF